MDSPFLGHLHPFTGLRVPAQPGRSGMRAESTEPTDFHPAAICQAITDRIQDGQDTELSVGLGEVGESVGEPGDEFRAGQYFSPISCKPSSNSFRRETAR